MSVPDTEFRRLTEKYPEHFTGRAIRKMYEEPGFTWFFQLFTK
jgi:hypothetical protein